MDATQHLNGCLIWLVLKSELYAVYDGVWSLLAYSATHLQLELLGAQLGLLTKVRLIIDLCEINPVLLGILLEVMRLDRSREDVGYNRTAVDCQITCNYTFFVDFGLIKNQALILNLKVFDYNLLVFVFLVD